MTSKLKTALRKLKSLDPDKRKKAIMALAKEQSLEAVQALENTAKNDTNLELRFLAKKALSKLQDSMGKEGEESNSTLDKQLESGSDEDKIRAIKQAAAQRRPDTLEKLLALLKVEESSQVRATALLAIGLLGSKSEISVFSQYIRDPDPNVRLNCVKALSYLDESLSYPLFVCALNDKTPQVATRAYGFLRKLGKENTIVLLKTMAQARHRWMRKEVAKACGRLNTPEVTPILRDVCANEKGDIRNYAIKSLKALTELGNKQARSLWSSLKAANSDEIPSPSPSSKPQKSAERQDFEVPLATRSAGFVIPSGDEDLPLNAKSAKERMQALQEIVDEGDPSRIPEILTRLRVEKNLKMKSALLNALGELGGEEEVEHIKPYLDHPDSRVRATAVENIGRLCPNDLHEILAPFLYDEDNRTAANAIVALGDCPQASFLPALEKLVRSKEINYRKSAIYAILQLENSEAAKHLHDLTNDEDEEVSQRAKEVLSFLKEKGILSSKLAKERKKERDREKEVATALKKSSMLKSQLPSRVDLDQTDFLQQKTLAPIELLKACHFNYAVALILALTLFGVLHLFGMDGLRFGVMLGIALLVCLTYVFAGLSLQAGHEWARQFTLWSTLFLPIPKLANSSRETLESEEALDYFNSNPKDPGVAGRSTVILVFLSLVVFIVLAIL